MTDRRRQYDQAPAHIARLFERIDSNASRVEDLFDRLNARLDRVDRDLAAKEQADETVRGELREMKRDVGELRDAVALGSGKAIKGAAEGAAQGAAAIGQMAVSKSAWVKFTAGAAGLVAIMSVLNNIPDVARGWDKLWTALKNEDAVSAAPKQDTTDGR